MRLRCSGMVGGMGSVISGIADEIQNRRPRRFVRTAERRDEKEKEKSDGHVGE